jgi:hypothetical protein
MTVTPLHREKAGVQSADPLRADLKRAIEAVAPKRKAIERNRDGQERAGALIAELEAKLEAATAATARAKERQGARLAAALANDRQVSLGSMTAARTREQEVADSLDSARGALTQLDAGLVEREEEARAAELRVEAAINAILAREAVEMIERLEKLKLESQRLQAILHFVRGRRARAIGGGRREVIPELAEPLREIEPRITHAVEVDAVFFASAMEQHAAAQEYAAACAALRENAEAKLPA